MLVSAKSTTCEQRDVEDGWLLDARSEEMMFAESGQRVCSTEPRSAWELRDQRTVATETSDSRDLQTRAGTFESGFEILPRGPCSASKWSLDICGVDNGTQQTGEWPAKMAL